LPLDGTIDTMKTTNPITDVLRKAITDTGLPLLRIEQDTGVQRASISRFVRGERSLRLDAADKLAAYLGLSLQSVPKSTKKRKG
jgi:plasmid maintenance system antidote protein VapI